MDLKFLRKFNVLRLIDLVRSSYSFLPTVMSVFAIVLAAGLTAVDQQVGTAWVEAFGAVYVIKPEGARVILSTIAGSMITVAGVVFSITIAAVSFASSQYGPRLLTNFMRDDANQVTLGTFIATFLYCTFVIRFVRDTDPLEVGVAAESFTPQIATMTGILFAFCSIAVLIYFIHHVPTAIHISRVIAGIGFQLQVKIGNRFPASIGRDPDDPEKAAASVPEAFRQNGETPALASAEVANVCALKSGYIQGVDEEQLMKTAGEKDLVVRLQFQPGGFVNKGDVLAQAFPASRADEETLASLRSAYAVGRTRTPVQDVMFLSRELAEIASRALSPGINDPFTAMSCIDWAGSAIRELCGARPPSRLRVDDEGALRVIAHPETFEDYLDQSFGAMRPYMAADINAALHMLGVLAGLGTAAETTAEKEALRRQIEALVSAAGEKLVADEAALVKDRGAEAVELLYDEGLAARLKDRRGWLGGRA